MTNRTAEVPPLSWTQVCARRLDRHALSDPSQDARPADIVDTIYGAHAQVLSAAESSIGLRLVGITRMDVQEALWTERSLVKTLGPRGAVHLLSAQDLPWWTSALSAIPPSRNSQAKDVRLTPEQTEAVVKAIAVVLNWTLPSCPSTS
jgi:Winged helix DNA-binding domain